MRAKELRGLLTLPQLTTFVGAHNALTALAVQRAGFEAIWAGSLELSAAHGLIDEEVITTTEVLATLTQINEATDLPVLVDFDTGRGSLSSLARAVRLFEHADVAGVCIEDKLFPKRNSFAPGLQQLATVDEFAGRIAAAVAQRRGADFLVVARTEALVIGLDVDETLGRVERYVNEGADALLLHSKMPDGRDIREFLRQWTGAVPVLVVPTRYPDVPTAELRRWGVNGVVHANVVLRTIIAALQENLGLLRQADCLGRLTSRMADFDAVLDFIRNGASPSRGDYAP